MLRNLRFLASESRGRRYPELGHPYRDSFQRDRDRIIHTHAFRRLENKTQVFARGISDHFRNRLTHTLEVAQLARTVARALDLNEDLTEALALVHDIGHPPFAHAGEEELNRQMARYGSRFDHNLHALRIVESFEERYPCWPGLNLTFEVREGIVKHSRDYQPGEFPEVDEYLPGLRPPIEAQIIDLADEIAYNTADLDDALSAGLITVASLADALPQWSEILEAVRQQYPGSGEHIQFFEALRRTIDCLTSGLIEGIRQAVDRAGVKNVPEVRACPERLARFTPEAAQLNRALKHFLHAHVYGSEQLTAARRQSVRLIGELFEFYIAQPERLPPAYREHVDGLPRHRLVCDYLAGMTDGYVERTHREAFQG